MKSPPLWNGVLCRLEQSIPAFALETWLRPLEVTVERDELRLRCPTAFHRDRVLERLLPQLVEVASLEFGQPMRVVLDVQSPSRSISDPARTQSRAEIPCSATDAAARRIPSRVGAPPPVGRDCTTTGTLRERQSQIPFNFTFESFVVGPCNALAREASMAFAQGRQLGVNTLYLAGESGVGKTHLARAVADSAVREQSARVLYTSGEQFTGEFLSSMHSKRLPSFKERFRQRCDLLIVDDIQFLRGKRATQLEFFHTLDHLVSSGRRVVLTADRLPRDCPEFHPRLRSRLTGGLIAEIERPDAEVRRRILRSKAASGGVRLPEDCLELLVSSVRGSVRDIEGSLIQLVASAALLKRPIDLELTQAALQKVMPGASHPSELRPEAVTEVVAAFFKKPPAALASRSRRRDVLLPRQLAMYLCRRYTGASLKRIGEAFDREHSAVTHAVATIERAILERAPLRYQVEALCTRLDELSGRKDDSS